MGTLEHEEYRQDQRLGMNHAAAFIADRFLDTSIHGGCYLSSVHCATTSSVVRYYLLVAGCIGGTAAV